MKIVKKLYRFLKYNHHKKLSIAAFCYSAVYRFQILWIHPKKLQKNWGVEGEESETEATPNQYRYALRVARAVDHACSRTTWESKCLVRALTAQHLLKRKEVPSTLYLGCGKEEERMIAHAWLRVGDMYVTGGNGAGYAIVSKFKS